MTQPTKSDFQRLSDSVSLIDKTLQVTISRLEGMVERTVKLEVTIEKLRDQLQAATTQAAVLTASQEELKKRWDGQIDASGRSMACSWKQVLPSSRIKFCSSCENEWG